VPFAILAALASAALGLACRGPEIERRHVLLLSVDTLRPDYLSFHGYDRPTSPFVDSLFARGLVFTRATTPLARTTPALASLLTGVYPHGHRVLRLFDTLPGEIVYLPELARAHGYATIAVVSNHILTEERGLQRGFDVYDFAPDARDAGQTTRAALQRLEGRTPDERIFLWVHYIDPHVPYRPPTELARAFDEGYQGRYALRFGDVKGGTGSEAYPRDLPKAQAVYRNPLPDAVNAHVRRLYAAEIRSTDDAIAELVNSLEERFGADWTIVFTSDHGESLGEHRYHYDPGEFVYGAGVRLPLGIVLPASDPLWREAVVDDWVSLVDLFPTLLDLMGIEPPAEVRGGIEGRSLLPYLVGRRPEPRPVFAESGTSYFPEEMQGRRVHFGVKGRLRSVMDGRWKLIWTPGQEPPRAFELYDLERDPEETENLYQPNHPELPRLSRLLERWLRDSPRPDRGPSAEDRRLLRSLGYVE
jgi:arylsulfatase A-like enzyme